jgi:nucleotide-binding universal stress UspA family protein
MNRVLIPFTDVESGERAVRKLLDEAPSPGLEVALLAVVEPLTPGKVGIFLSPQRAEALARAAAARWLERIGALLDAANIRHRSEIAVGPAATIVEGAIRRRNVDRVLLPSRRPRWLSAMTAAQQSAKLTRAVRHAVTVVS